MAFWPYGVLFRKTFYNVVNAIICCWILKECNLSSKIVKNCRIIGLNRAKKTKFWPRSVWLKNSASQYCLPQTSWKIIFERLVYTPPDLSPRFTCKVTWSFLIFYFGHPLQSVNWLPPRTIVCFIKELSINLIKLRWLATGLFCLGRICFSGLIYSDRTWLLFGCTYETINSM